MLGCWLDSTSKTTWEAVGKALYLMKTHDDVAVTIQKKYILTLRALTNELQSVFHWHTLGVKLGLENHELSIIEENHRGDVERCRTEMLGCWLNNATTPTWEAVAEALDMMNEHGVADTIRKKYITSATTTNTGGTLVFQQNVQ